jgi:ribonuclease P/MRP protein subunit POP5
MKKLKPLLPSLKEKKRYLAFEVISKQKMHSFDDFSRAFWNRALQFVGEAGAGKAGFWLLSDTYKNNRGLIKVNHKYTEELRAILCTMDTINNQDTIVRSLGMSGIVNKAAKYTEVN